MKDPDQLWFDLVKRFSQQSKCLSRGVGAILVDEKGHLFGQGWNSAPFGSKSKDCPRCVKTCDSGSKLDQAICSHAEANAIGNASRSGRPTSNATLYCTTYPCAECAKLIVAAGIKEVVYNEPYPSPLTDHIFQNANIHIRRFFACSTSPENDSPSLISSVERT